jgi:chromosome segregation ATPase
MFESEKISGAQAAELRAIYGRMAADLEARKNYEKELINKARDLSDSLDQQKVQLNKCDEDLEQPSVKPAGKTANDAKVNEVITLRNQLMKCMNEISMLEEKSQENTYQLEVLTEHRRLMSLEKDRQPDPEKMMEQALDLKRTNELDDKALKIMASTIKQTLEHNETLEKEIDEIKAKLEKAIEDQDHVTAELVANSTVDGMHPAELARCIDKLGKTQESLGIQVETENLKLNEVNVHLGEKMHEYGILKEQSQGVKRSYDDSENKNQNKEREFALVNSDFNKEKERESELLHMKDDLEIRQRLLDQERNHVHDQVSRKRREFDRESKSLKKKMLQSQQLTDAKSQLEKLCANANSELLNFPKDEQGEKERRNLDIEVKVLSKRKESEEMNVRVERDAWDQILENIGKLSKEQEQARTLVYEQGRMHHLKSDEREQKSRDVQRAKNRLKQVEREEKAKDLELKNHKKRSSELGQEQDDFAKRYEQIKNEKNKYVNLIQSSSQKREELKEKLRLLANEIEVLQQRLNKKDKEVNQAVLKNQNAEGVRDQCQSRINKARQKHSLLIDELDQAKLNVSKLTCQNNQAEEEMLKLREKYESAVRSRNERGITLIEREEEVCVFYEKLNIQENVMRRADVKLEEFNDEMTFLNTQLAEEQRQVEILRKYRPELKELKNELVDLQIELAKVQDKTVDLEQKLENPDACKNRIRFLEGKDLSPRELESELAKLELRLAQKEEQHYEKTLIFDQVDRLLSNLQEKQTAAVDDKRVLADQCAESKARLQEMNRKMLALISEIGMERANNGVLQQNFNELETSNQLANERFSKGEPPSEDMMIEWKKKVRNDRRRHEEKLREYGAMVEMQKHVLPNGGGLTTAEPRPNAYLTTNIDDMMIESSNGSNSTGLQSMLPVPKPYGSMAPFKPQPQGAQMRHIRKPKAKPLEI